MYPFDEQGKNISKFTLSDNLERILSHLKRKATLFYSEIYEQVYPSWGSFFHLALLSGACALGNGDSTCGSCPHFLCGCTPHPHPLIFDITCCIISLLCYKAPDPTHSHYNAGCLNIFYTNTWGMGAGGILVALRKWHWNMWRWAWECSWKCTPVFPNKKAQFHCTFPENIGVFWGGGMIW